MKTSVSLFLAALAAFSLASCNTVYMAAMEQIGFEKRDLLKSAVKAARGEQKEAGEEFQDALTQLKAVSGFNGGNLETAYNEFKAEYEDCESQAARVRSKIKDSDQVAAALFREWEKEIGQYSNAGLTSDSRRKLAETRGRYAQLSSTLHTAEAAMEPVLRQFHDQVLYLKHNLNAAAIGSLRGHAATSRVIFSVC